MSDCALLSVALSPKPPITIDFEALAVASGPIATVLSPSAFAKAPMATTLSFVALAF